MKRTLRRFVAPVGVAATLLTIGGCATKSERVLGYATWNHFLFSMRASWQEFVGWSPVATSEDEATAHREGGWWGAEVPTLPAR